MTASLKWQRLIRQEAAGRLKIQSARDALDQRTRAMAPAFASTPTDFAQRLTSAVDVQAVVATAQIAATEANVTLAGMQLQQRPATSELLARNDLTLSLRGTHPKLKQVLADLLGRYPNATLKHMNLRRNGSPEQVEATMVIGVWGAPLAADAPVPATEAR